MIHIRAKWFVRAVTDKLTQAEISAILRNIKSEHTWHNKDYNEGFEGYDVAVP